MMSKVVPIVLICALAILVSVPSAAAEVDARAVFERLKSLAGTWRGEAEGEGEEAEAEAERAGEVVHEIRVSAAGSVVMETMNPGTGHEMINMYHLDGQDVVLTHYCAGGNQPHMKLDRQRSTPDKLFFDFAGGTNLDAAVDPHIHSAEITLVEQGELESAWTAYADGKQVAVMTFHLSRSK